MGGPTNGAHLPGAINDPGDDDSQQPDRQVRTGNNRRGEVTPSSPDRQNGGQEGEKEKEKEKERGAYRDLEKRSEPAPPAMRARVRVSNINLPPQRPRARRATIAWFGRTRRKRRSRAAVYIPTHAA
jgi:hypothetical protein